MRATGTAATTGPPYSTRQVADEHGVSVKTVVAWIVRGVTIGGRTVTLRQLGAYQIGKAWRVPRETLAEWLRLSNGGEAPVLVQELARDRRRRAAEDAAAAKRLDEQLGPGWRLPPPPR